MNTTDPIPAEKYFYTVDGKTLKSLPELENYLATCSEDAFMHHVNAQKNDFYNWILHVFNEEECAKQIATTTNRGSMRLQLQLFLRRQLIAQTSGMPIESPTPSTPISTSVEATAAEHILINSPVSEDQLTRFAGFASTRKDDQSDDVRIALLREKLAELHGKVSELRRVQKNPIIPDLLARNAKVKIDYYAITRDAADYQKVIDAFAEIAQEIEYCANEKTVNVKEELGYFLSTK